MKLVIAVAAIFAGTLLIVLFAIGGSFWTHAISNLGDPRVTDWWWTELIVYCLVGFLLVPYTRQMYHLLHARFKFFKIAWALFTLLGGLGLAATGILNESLGLAHIISAIFAFGGLGLALFLSLCLMTSNFIKGHESIVRARFLVLLAVVDIGIIIMAFEIMTYGVTDPKNLFFLEWIAMFTLMAWLVLFPWVHNWKKQEKLLQ